MKVAEVFKEAKKKFGDKIGGIGEVMPDCQRCPSGILSFDVASGGGLPLNRLSIVYGPESSGKTNFALVMVRQFQQRFPDKTCAYIDIEGTLEETWAKRMGVDTKKLAPVWPDYAEQVVDVTTDLLLASDCGLIVVDSIGALATMSEVERSAEDQTPGGQGRAVAKLVRKTTLALNEARKDHEPPTMIWISQPYDKIGVMFGDPEGLTGGKKQRFMASLMIRLTSKGEIDPKVSKELPAFKLTKGTIKKHKVPILNQNFEYRMVVIPNRGLGVGRTNDWPVAKQYLEEYGLLGRDDKGRWNCLGTEFASQKEVWEWLRIPENLDGFREHLVKRKMDSMYEEAGEPTAGEETEE